MPEHIFPNDPRRVAELIIRYPDGSEEYLKFKDENQGFYRVWANHDAERKPFTRHEIFWTERPKK